MTPTPEEVAKILMEDDPNPRLITGFFDTALKQIDGIAELTPEIVELMKVTFFLGVSSYLTVENRLVQDGLPRTSTFVKQKIHQEVEEFFKSKAK